MKKSKLSLQIFFIIASIIVIVITSTSLSKYVTEQKDEIKGSYTDFTMVHDAYEKSIILEEENTKYSGYLEFNVYNYDKDKVSARDIIFSLRLPTSEEIRKKEVDDGWGTKLPIKSPSEEKYQKYNIDIDENTTYSIEGDGEKRGYVQLIVPVVYTPSSGESITDNFNDEISLILETTSPYITRQVIDIKIASSKVSFTIKDDNYYGFTEKTVTIKTAKDFSINNNYYPLDLEFIITNASLDDERLKNEYNLTFENNKILGILPGSTIVLHFYIYDKPSIKVKASFNGDTYDNVSGLGGIIGDYYTIYEEL